MSISMEYLVKVMVLRDKIERWVSDKRSLEQDFRFYFSKNVIRKTTRSKEDIKGHLAKMEHNLIFANKVLEMGDFFDWAITAYYYAIYQASLPLIINKGFYSKNHMATLLLLIKCYYPMFTEKEMNFIDDLYEKTVDKKLLYSYTFLKAKREEASYTIKTSYDRKEVEEIKKKAINFANKAMDIIGR